MVISLFESEITMFYFTEKSLLFIEKHVRNKTYFWLFRQVVAYCCMKVVQKAHACCMKVVQKAHACCMKVVEKAHACCMKVVQIAHACCMKVVQKAHA